MKDIVGHWIRSLLPTLFITLVISSDSFSQAKNQVYQKNTTDIYRESREKMVRVIESYGFHHPKILDIMRTVPRHLFIPKSEQWQAYHDNPVPIGHGQTISQPYIVAYMTEKAIQNNGKVLEIGTGSGYQASILSYFYKNVYTIEIVKDLAQESEKRLKSFGYSNITVKNADGYYGWKEFAPFDAILVTAAAESIPPPLVQQLKNGGQMIIPVGSVFQVQSLMLVSKDNLGKIKTESLMPVRFVPLIH